MKKDYKRQGNSSSSIVSDRKYSLDAHMVTPEKARHRIYEQDNQRRLSAAVMDEIDARVNAVLSNSVEKTLQLLDAVERSYMSEMDSKLKSQGNMTENHTRETKPLSSGNKRFPHQTTALPTMREKRQSIDVDTVHAQQRDSDTVLIRRSALLKPRPGNLISSSQPGDELKRHELGQRLPRQIATQQRRWSALVDDDQAVPRRIKIDEGLPSIRDKKPDISAAPLAMRARNRTKSMPGNEMDMVSLTELKDGRRPRTISMPQQSDAEASFWHGAPKERRPLTNKHTKTDQIMKDLDRLSHASEESLDARDTSREAPTDGRSLRGRLARLISSDDTRRRSDDFVTDTNDRIEQRRIQRRSLLAALNESRTDSLNRQLRVDRGRRQVEARRLSSKGELAVHPQRKTSDDLRKTATSESSNRETIKSDSYAQRRRFTIANERLLRLSVDKSRPHMLNAGKSLVSHFHIFFCSYPEYKQCSCR